MSRTVEDILCGIKGGYRIEVSDSCSYSLDKKFKKDRPLYREIRHTFLEMSNDPFRGEPLRFGLKGNWHVHVNGSYVMVYKVNKKTKTVRIEGYSRHDRAYRGSYKRRR